MRTGLLLILLLLMPLLFLQAQQNGSGDDILERQFMLETLKSRALDAMSRGEIAEALDILDTAIALSPDDTVLREMRLSLREMQMLKEDEPVATEEDTSTPSFYDPPAGREDEETEVETPDFAGELFAGAQFVNPYDNREAFIGVLGFHYGRSRPVYLEDDMFYPHGAYAEDNPEYGLFGDLQYFFERVDRAMGVNLRYYGNVLNPEGADLLLHQMDLGILFRGFFQESATSRTVLGFRFGVSLLYLNEYVESRQEPALANSLTFGAFLSDAFLRHIFRKNPFFEKFVLDFGTDYYYLTVSESSYMIRYNGALSYRITPEFRLGLAGRILSTAEDLQILSSWDAGIQLTYTY